MRLKSFSLNIVNTTQENPFYTQQQKNHKQKSRNVRKRTFGYVRSAKIQISLCIRAVWSESSLGAFAIAKNAKFLQADNEVSYQTAQTSSHI